MRRRRNCFGTKEFSINSGICKGCKDYRSCQQVREKRIDWKRLEKTIYNEDKK